MFWTYGSVEEQDFFIFRFQKGSKFPTGHGVGPMAVYDKTGKIKDYYW